MPQAPPPASTPPLFAAVTGDVVRSSRFTGAAIETLQQALRQASNLTEKAFPGLLQGRIHHFRGDGLQFLVTAPSRSPRIALYYLAALKELTAPSPLDLRLSIGIGTVDRIPEEDGSGGDGPAYRVSGRALESMRVQNRFCYSVVPNLMSHDLAASLDGQCGLLGALAENWTSRQSQMVRYALVGCTQAATVKNLAEPVSRQAVAKALDAASWRSVEQSLRIFESISLD